MKQKRLPGLKETPIDLAVRYQDVPLKNIPMEYIYTILSWELRDNRRMIELLTELRRRHWCKTTECEALRGKIAIINRGM